MFRLHTAQQLGLISTMCLMLSCLYMVSQHGNV